MRLGKLPLSIALHDLPDELATGKFRMVDVELRHDLHELAQVPATKDPFDRLLLAVAEIEDARLLTADAKLLDHPLAWRPA